MAKAWCPRSTFNSEMALEEWLETYWPDIWDEQQEAVVDRMESGDDDFDTYGWMGENYPNLPDLFDAMWAMVRQQRDIERTLVAANAAKERGERASMLINDVYPAFRGALRSLWGLEDKWPSGASGTVLCREMRDFLYPGWAELDAIAEEDA